MQQSVYPIVLAGGQGTRLWPLSRQSHPKQFISLVDESSLLQNTLERLFRSRVECAPPIVVCHEDYRFIVAQQLKDTGGSSATILLEPESKNTAPSVALGALAAQSQASKDENPVLLVLPADHAIEDEAVFAAALSKAIDLARKDESLLITLGVKPTSPSTDYGYIQRGEAMAEDAFQAKCFIEKPNVERAKSLLAAGDYFWNSGVFVFSSRGYLAALARHAPSVHEAVQASWQSVRHDEDFVRLEGETFCQSPKISIDYAVMEVADNVAMVVLDTGWSDLGSWSALSSFQQPDAEGNYKHGDVILHNTSNSYVRASSHLVAVLGVSDLVVVDTPDALLIANKHAVDDVRIVLDKLARSERQEHKINRMVYKPWGNYNCLDAGEGYLVKHIVVDPGQSLSLQSHRHRAEHWVVLKGTARVTCNDKTYSVQQNESSFIPLGAKHRLENLGRTPLEIIEVQSGAHISEDDVIRYQDIYGR